MPKPLAKEFHEERTRLLALSFMPLDHENKHHLLLLNDVYRLYLGLCPTCDRCRMNSGCFRSQENTQGMYPVEENTGKSWVSKGLTQQLSSSKEVC